MKFKTILFSIGLILVSVIVINFAVSDDSEPISDIYKKADTRIDNNGYWIKMAEKGLATLNPVVKDVPKAIYTGSQLKGSRLILTEDSPDVPVTEENSTQSENSIFVNPNDNNNLLNSNNSTTNPVGTLYGANDLFSFDGGETWDGEIAGAGGSNSGDPATAISNSGRWFVGYIGGGGQGVSYSDNEGATWTKVTVATGSGLLDKNHMWIDNSTSSPYEGNLYDAWTPFGGSNVNQIELCYSDSDGESWSSPVSISNAVNAGSHNQGVNLSTGPNGEAYAVWAIYDSWPSDETALGFAKSLDGGESWEPAVRIISDIRGIRTSETSKNMRVNSFPSMDVDISSGSRKGNIYVVWANIGEPGVNSGSDIDVYMIKSTDEGDSWSDPIRVNQDPTGTGAEHYFPWIACDAETGALSIVYYDDRNVGGSQCETYVSNSMDGGETWEDMKVSDVAFTPSPIPGLAGGYFGDYLGITARGGMVYPCWTDNRSGHAMTYVSPFQLLVVHTPYNLKAVIDQDSGVVDLSWSFSFNAGFEYFKIKRNGFNIANTNNLTFSDHLDDYGYYTYEVSAVYAGNLESDPVSIDVQWGSAHIATNTDVIYDTVLIGETSTKTFLMKSTGELPLIYQIDLNNPGDRDDTLEYCDASGGCGPYIQQVEVGDILNTTECTNYGDYTDISTDMKVGKEYPITITNGAGDIWNACKIWIDWNKNEDFTDDYPVVMSGTPGPGPYTATIKPPPYAVGGETRMRIRLIEMGHLNPCGYRPTGEVEDYTINVINWLTISPSFGELPAGDSTDVSITADGNLADLGQHQYEIMVASNDPDHPEYPILYNLSVLAMMAEASSAPAEICEGESAQVSVEVYGGSGEYSYSWTSNPEGYTSNEQNPVFYDITENTTFTVEVDDGTNQVYANTTVTVHPLPDINLGGTIHICEGESHTFDAGAGYESYLWSNGSTGQSITVDQAGNYWVEVTSEFGCTNTDEAELIVNANPTVSLGPDTAFCKDQNITLDAGNAGATYLWSNGETTQTIMVDTNTFDVGVHNIWVEVTNESSCSSYDTVEVEIKNCYFGIDEVFAYTQIEIYPNPNHGEFTVSIRSGATQNLNLRLLNSSGDEIFSTQEIDTSKEYIKQFNLKQLSSGIYMLVIEKDGFFKMKKIIIH